MKKTFTTGLMGSGKSKTLIEEIESNEDLAVAFAVRIDGDVGCMDVVSSRNGRKIYALTLVANEHDKNLKYLSHSFSLDDLRDVYIDEVQFLPRQTVEKIIELAEEHDINLHFFGLSTTFTTEYFDSAEYLLNTIPKRDLRTIAMFCENDDCKNIAEYNARIIDGKVARSGETFLSQKSKYKAVCEGCYYND